MPPFTHICYAQLLFVKSVGDNLPKVVHTASQIDMQFIS